MAEVTLQKTPLSEVHQALGARMVDFGGWWMPVQYPAGILKEHKATREGCGLFDTCHMGEFLLEGPEVAKALNCACAGDFSKLKVGRARYTFLTNAAGGVIDDAVVMLFSNELAWMVVNAGDIPGDFAALASALPEGVAVTNQSAATGKLDIQGPTAWKVVQEVTGMDLRTLPFYSFVETSWKGAWMVFSRSGYTGEPGVELYVAAERVGELWEALHQAGAEPCGLGARDTLRLEAGLPLYGHELSPTISPLEAGFDRFVSLAKAERFPGKEALVASEVKRRLVGLEILDKRVPRAHFPVRKGGAQVGEITSGAPAPTLEKNIAFALVERAAAELGESLEVEVRGKALAAKVVPLPFYSNPLLREIRSGD